MKFITEYDLRARFQQQPFTEYQLSEDIRLTPGARQFLSDQRITIQEQTEKIASKQNLEGCETKIAETSETAKEQRTLPDREHQTESFSGELTAIMKEMEQMEQRVLDLAKISIHKDLEMTLQLIDVTTSISKVMNLMTQILHTYAGGQKCRQKK